MNKLKIEIQRFIGFIFIDKKTRLQQFETTSELDKSQSVYSSLSFQFLIMLTAASLISSLGLLSDSGVVIVGAMLIAPLMKPIMSLSYGISTGDSSLKLRSCITLAIGVILTVFISYLSELTLQLNLITEQMENRIAPNLFDLGVAISAGIASAIALTRRSVADSLPGVAIAVAIVISAICVFLLSGYGSIRNALFFITTLVFFLITVAFPLKESLVLIEDTDRVQSILETWLYENYPENVAIHPADLNNIDVVEQPEYIFVFIELKSPENGLSEQQLTYLHEQFEIEFSKPVNLNIQFLLTQELLKYSYKVNDQKRPIYGKDALIPRK